MFSTDGCRYKWRSQPGRLEESDSSLIELGDCYGIRVDVTIYLKLVGFQVLYGMLQSCKYTTFSVKHRRYAPDLYIIDASLINYKYFLLGKRNLRVCGVFV
mmetsp:Transcript_4078/g.7159  ORF Transcript_4078/g.7159 Transcript_4078/m.7159 type:complete len:101 (-) Transcript_4078:1383-1685(-)